MDDTLSIGEVAHRAGVATSALRFYEREGLLTARRSDGGQRRYDEVLRRVAFIGAAKRVGLSLDEIREAMASLPGERTPTVADWAKLSRSWLSRLAAEIEMLERLRDDLTSCIGCGCLSFRACKLYNPDDAAAELGDGPRYLLGDTPADLARPPGPSRKSVGNRAATATPQRGRHDNTNTHDTPSTAHTPTSGPGSGTVRWRPSARRR